MSLVRTSGLTLLICFVSAVVTTLQRRATYENVATTFQRRATYENAAASKNNVKSEGIAKSHDPSLSIGGVSVERQTIYPPATPRTFFWKTGECFEVIYRVGYTGVIN